MSSIPAARRFPIASAPEGARDLRWLWHLRWFAFAGQATTVLITAFFLPIPLFLPGLVGVLAFDLVLTCLVGLFLRHFSEAQAIRWCFILLCADTVALTLLLHWSGGAHNPFTSFYFLHIALAAILLSRFRALIVAGLSVVGYGLLHQRVLEMCGLGTTWGGIPEDLHHRGMVVALVLTGGSLAWFVGGLRADLRQREEELRLSREKLAREERFSGIATLAAGVAHELATPLGTIALVCRELERTTASGSCAARGCGEDMRLIREQVDRCRAIIDRLNADSDADLGAEPEPLRIDSLPALLAPELAPEVARRLRWTLAPGSSGLVLHAPRTPLLQALGVLLKNATEADPSGAPVELAVALANDPASPVICLSVRDSGPGLAPQIAAHVGEPFLTTKAPGQGMGLGLYIVRLFAERRRGRLDIFPRPHGGTEARLSLPLSSPP
jgi:two-component system sensor histidine kinase RegB